MSPIWQDDNAKRSRANLSVKIEGLLQHWRTRGQRTRSDVSSAFRVLEIASMPLQDAKKPVVLRRRRQHVKIEDNWPLFYYQFSADHSRFDLIWNFKVGDWIVRALAHLVGRRARSCARRSPPRSAHS